jgi:peptidyl-prolyl cis-trans isomerase A (cyclophilin A)
MPSFRIGVALAGALIILSAGCSSTGSDPLLKPSFVQMATVAPDSFQVRMETSAGPVDLVLYREWSPLGVDRAFYLFRKNFYEGGRFYRVIDDFVAQFGGSGDVAVDSLWRTMPLRDEPVVGRNTRGTISYARAGAGTRSFTMYINLKDNLGLDTNNQAPGVVGYPPIGRVVSGMDVVEKLYSEYDWRVVARTDLSAETLRRDYPRLDSIAATSVTRMW